MKRFSILRLNLRSSESSPVVKEFSEFAIAEFETTLCSFFKTESVRHPDVKYIDGDNTIGGFFCALNRALGKEKYDIIHAHYAHVGLLYVIFVLISLRWKRPFCGTVYTVHTSYQNLKFRNRIMTAIIFLTNHRVVFCGESSAASFPQWFRSLAGKRTRIIPNGINLDAIAAIRDSVSLEPRGRPRIIAIGRLIALKNFGTIIRAVSELDVDLTIVGEGELKDTLIRIAKDYGIADRVELVGTLSRIDVYHYLVQSDVFVSASVIEGLPKAVLEAMACDCPVVLSDIPSHREIAAKSKSPIALVSPLDTAGFEAAIKTLINMSPLERRKRALDSRKAVEDHYNLRRMHVDYFKVYRELVDYCNPCS